MAASASSCSAAVFEFITFWQPSQLRPSTLSPGAGALGPTLGCIPSATPLSHSFDTFAQESDLWTDSELSLADTDWNFLSLQNAPPYPTAFDAFDMSVNDPGYGVASAYPSLSDSGSIESQALPTSSLASSSANSQDGYSNASPATQILSLGPTTSQPSPATSQGDSVLSRVESSRVEKRKLNTLAARRCRQRRVDQTKNLEDELERMRKERDELRLKVSRLEGETQALKGLLARKSN
ncbi:bZIP transcription factor bZIP-1 [Penicillium verhagenii]|nr:bZIP transcription factor bZIP-1 [Penicillium verhagenii]